MAQDDLSACNFQVQLYIYDMSKGMAKALSALFLGKEIHGIWHTSVVAFGREYFFGGTGIESCDCGQTILGPPDQVIELGITELPYSLFLEYITSLSDSSFSPGSYDLFNHNCNNFSNEVAQFLTGKSIPEEILQLPSEVLNTPIGQTIKQYLDSIAILPPGVGVHFGSNQQVNQQISPRVEKIVKPIQNNVIDQKSSNSGKVDLEVKPTVMTNPDAQVPKEESKPQSDEVEEELPKEKPVSTRKAYKYDDPPIIFKDVDGVAAIKKLSEFVMDLLSPEQQQLLKEFSEYLTTESGAWALGNEHLDLISHLLSGGEGKFAPNVPLLVIEALQAAALKDDFVLILHQDRKDHRLMSYINKIENLTLAEQEEIAKLICNLCSQPSTFDWLLYISEWTESDGSSTNNSRVTTRAAVHTVLNDKLTTLQKTGVSLIFNLALKELFDDTATELATAVLQFLHSDLQEDQAFFCLTALFRFMNISYNDVPALVKMLGPDLSKFKGASSRIDTLIEQINLKLQSSLPSIASE